MAQSVMGRHIACFIPQLIQRGRVCLSCVLIGSVVATASYAADALRDPTRPANLLSKDGKGNGGEGSNGEESLVLQSILIAPKRQVAIINGQAVARDGKIGAYTLAQLSETEVVLRRTGINKKQTASSVPDADRTDGKQRITLKLFPDFEKKRIVKNNNE